MQSMRHAVNETWIHSIYIKRQASKLEGVVSVVVSIYASYCKSFGLRSYSQLTESLLNRALLRLTADKD